MSTEKKRSLHVVEIIGLNAVGIPRYELGRVQLNTYEVDRLMQHLSELQRPAMVALSDRAALWLREGDAIVIRPTEKT